jgi:hypothetical protein
MTHADAKLGKTNARASALSRMFPRRRFDGGHSIVPGSKELFNRKSEDFIGSHVPDPKGPESKPEDYEYMVRDFYKVEIKGEFATITHVKGESKKWVEHGSARTEVKGDGQ